MSYRSFFEQLEQRLRRSFHPKARLKVTYKRNFHVSGRRGMNRALGTHLMKRRGRMMVLPGCDRVGAYTRVGAGKINGQHFAAAR